jgi:hypothetical protein
MYIPELKVSIIDFETNAGFICNYCSKEKSENKTRPFFDKTIKLYPELVSVQDIADSAEREAFIREVVVKKLKDNLPEIHARIEHFQEVFGTFIPEFIEAECRIFNYEWKSCDPEIQCYVGYLPFYPRSAKDKAFYVSYQDEERVFSGAVHEINHMIFFEKWKEMHGESCEERQWPDPLWYLEEIIVDPTLNDERVKPHTLYENKAYHMFYEKDSSGVSLMDKIKECYGESGSIEAFLDDSYEIIRKHFEG